MDVSRDRILIDEVDFDEAMPARIALALRDRLVERVATSRIGAEMAIDVFNERFVGDPDALTEKIKDNYRSLGELQRMKVFDTNAGPVRFVGATPVLAAAIAEFKDGLREGDAGHGKIGRALSSLIAYITQNASTFRAKVGQVASALRGIEVDLYDGVLAQTEGRGPVTIVTDVELLEKDPQGIYAKELIRNKRSLERRAVAVQVISLALIRTDATDPEALLRMRQDFLAMNKGFSDVLFAPASATDLASVLQRYDALQKARIVLVTGQGRMTAEGVGTGDKRAVVLQVHQEAEGLGQVATVAAILGLSTKEDVLVPGLERTPEGIYVIKPLMMVLNEIYKRLKMEEMAVGTAA
jgi:hypothetical protein